MTEVTTEETGPTKVNLLKRELQPVPIPDGHFCAGLFVQSCSGSTFERLVAHTTNDRAELVRGELLCEVIVDGGGLRVFSDADALTIGRLPAKQTQGTYELALTESGLGGGDVDTKADAKN